MPFAIDQDKTYRLEEDKLVQVKICGADGLDKWQFTAHFWSNAGTGEDLMFKVDLIVIAKQLNIVHRY